MKSKNKQCTVSREVKYLSKGLFLMTGLEWTIEKEIRNGTSMKNTENYGAERQNTDPSKVFCGDNKCYIRELKLEIKISLINQNKLKNS